MRDELLDRYFINELQFLEQALAEYGAKHDDVRRSLNLDDLGRSTDPHVTFLIQAVAHLTGRIQLRLDDQYPRFTEALLSALYPWYLTPIPPTTIVRFE